MSKNLIRFSRPIFALLMLFILAGQSSLFAEGNAVQNEEQAEHEKFDAGEMILHHIADAHEIHFIEGVSLPLPVILFDNGLKIFSSSKFYENPKELETSEGEKEHYYAYGDYVMVHEHIYKADENGGVSFEEGAKEIEVTNESVTDLSLTKTVAGVLLTCLLLILLFGTAAKSYKKRKGQAPKGLQSFLEPFIIFVRDDIAVPSIGEKKVDRYLPFLLSIFFFIWIANMLGMIPFLGGFNITGTMAVTLVLAGIVFIITTFSGNKHYWGHIVAPPNVPFLVKLILVPIEIASIFIKPIVLMIRLTANITAGHIIFLAFAALIIIFGESSGDLVGHVVGVGSTLFMVFMFFIELLVAFLQAYVFTLLAAIYFGDATQEAHS